MAYTGGKQKCYKHIINALNNPKFDNMIYIEPFVGYCHILRRVERKKKYYASDSNCYLITLLKHLQNDRPLKHPAISKTEYYKLKNNIDHPSPTNDNLKIAYAGFCYSYSGKWFAGYTAKYTERKNDKVVKRNYARERKRYYDMLSKNETFLQAKLSCYSYTKYSRVKNCIIYCDPPYNSTTGYKDAFDSCKFYDWVRNMSKNNYVFISEYTMPNDFTCIASDKKFSSMAGKGANSERIEKLFVHNTLVDKLKL